MPLIARSRATTPAETGPGACASYCTTMKRGIGPLRGKVSCSSPALAPSPSPYPPQVAARMTSIGLDVELLSNPLNDGVYTFLGGVFNRAEFNYDVLFLFSISHGWMGHVSSK